MSPSTVFVRDAPAPMPYARNSVLALWRSVENGALWRLNLRPLLQTFPGKSTDGGGKGANSSFFEWRAGDFSREKFALAKDRSRGLVVMGVHRGDFFRGTFTSNGFSIRDPRRFIVWTFPGKSFSDLGRLRPSAPVG